MNFINLYALDNRDPHYSQFLVAKYNNTIVGFARIRKHKGCDEFCSLGVVEKNRFNGIAKQLIEARLKIATQPIFLVCVIPNYFKKMGFVVTKNYPPEIADKLNYCNSELNVPEKYVVMTYVKNKELK